METELTPIQIVNAEKRAVVAALIPLLTAFVEAVDALDPELFLGGPPEPVKNGRMQALMTRAKLGEFANVETGPIV